MKTIAVIGLGYVGLGLAVALSKKYTVIGHDRNKLRLQELRQHYDSTFLVETKELKKSRIRYTDKIEDIQAANFYIVAVQTPVHFFEIPDLSPLITVTQKIAKILKPGDIVVYESTVYPGTTEEVCIPLLEKNSHLVCGQDFNVGYSPERINPGDKVHILNNITKIVSAQNEKTLKEIIEVYKKVCETLYPVSSIAIAEATKVLENTQRDVNIALMNEYTKIMHALNLDMHEVIEAAKTKWGFMPYKPGFVGGHCISIDPHYAAFQAKKHGVQPELILTSRRINDGMTQFVLQSLMKIIVQNHIEPHHTVGIFGVSFKENTPDTRNSLALKLIKELCEYGFKCHIHDPMDHGLTEKLKLQKIKLERFENIKDLSIAIIVVGHDFYREIGLKKILEKCRKPCVVMDIPNIYVEEYKKFDTLIYWNL